MKRHCAILVAAAIAWAGCGDSGQPVDTVVVYTSVDDVFARPIAEKFTAQTGIRVKLVPDTEETKSTGLLNRLIAERNRPVADVFWSGDPMRAAVLKARGGFAAAQIDTLSEAISRSLLANNRRLQEDIEAAFRSLEE